MQIEYKHIFVDALQFSVQKYVIATEFRDCVAVNAYKKLDVLNKLTMVPFTFKHSE